jgi:hypothetical protein
MPNITITKAWEPHIAADLNFLLTCTASITFEAYPMPDDETAPNLDEGHTLSPWKRDALNRAVIGPGVIWLRIAASESAATARAVLSTWGA